MAPPQQALPGYGAFKREDVEDAKRARPDSDLTGYAEARGLDFLDGIAPGGYQGVAPGYDTLQFNVLRCRLGGGRHGMLFHHLLAVPYQSREFNEADAAGVRHVYYRPKRGLRFGLGFIPVLGTVLDEVVPEKDKRPDAIGVPTTEAGTLVPEVAVVPPFELTQRKGVNSLGPQDPTPTSSPG